MDSALKLKLDDYKKALDGLDAVLQIAKNDIVRDSAVKRFEFTFELCWKTAKLFLREKHGLDAFSPKDVFRELRNVGVIDDRETEIILKMSNDRNLIVHTYVEKFSDYLYEAVKSDYYPLAMKIYSVIKGN
jgi:nucleotidyltransferase substrate binding protein (TIGR01987 family)